MRRRSPISILCLVLVCLACVAVAGCDSDGPTQQKSLGAPDASEADANASDDTGQTADGTPSEDATPIEDSVEGDVDASPQMCGDPSRSHQKVYYGTREPTELPLTPGQILAVGSFDGCTGTLIAPRWVLSASHCSHNTNATFCMGTDPDNPDRCVGVTRVLENPDADQTLLELDEDARTVMPGVEPIPILTEIMDDSWIGRIAEAAGYGTTETGAFNTRYFTAEPIVAFWGTFMVVDGEGVHGLCFGDSGGPVMVLASDGTVRVAGDLSQGDGSCVGRDQFARTDLFRDWIEGHTGPTLVGDAPCGDVTLEGRCFGEMAAWCDGGVLATDACGICGWSEQARGFRCIEDAHDPCGGFDSFGACDLGIARWCDGGELRARNCDACGEVCEEASGVGAICAPDPCDGLDYLGQCDGNVVQWCDEHGQPRDLDCGSRGQSCGWISDQYGYFCQ